MSAGRIGAQLRTARERYGISQADLGKRMRLAGFRWSQATVWAIESGQRNLLYVEALALRELIRFDAPDNINADLLRDSSTLRRIIELIETDSAAVTS